MVYSPHSNPLPTMEEWVTRAVDFMLQNPNASVSESMVAVQVFNATECSNWSLQQRVRHYHKMRLVSVPSTVAVSGNSPLNMSPLTDTSFISLQKMHQWMLHQLSSSCQQHHQQYHLRDQRK